MEFLKKHYEKIILSVVLLGLGGAVGYLLWKIPSEREALETKRIGIISKPVKALPELNLTTNEAALQATFDGLNYRTGRPHMIVANTVCGKGVSFMEGQVKWHYWPMNDLEYAQAVGEVEGADP